MAEAGLAMADLDGIAFAPARVPFTGLRVVCGVAQFAVALDRPVLPVVTLEAMAWRRRQLPGGGLSDARMNEVYCGAYRRVGEVLELQGAITVCPPAEAPLPAAGDWAVCGNGVPAYPALEPTPGRLAPGRATGADGSRGGPIGGAPAGPGRRPGPGPGGSPTSATRSP